MGIGTFFRTKGGTDGVGGTFGGGMVEGDDVAIGFGSLTGVAGVGVAGELFAVLEKGDAVDVDVAPAAEEFEADGVFSGGEGGGGRGGQGGKSMSLLVLGRSSLGDQVARRVARARGSLK